MDLQWSKTHRPAIVRYSVSESASPWRICLERSCSRRHIRKLCQEEHFELFCQQLPPAPPPNQEPKFEEQ